MSSRKYFFAVELNVRNETLYLNEFVAYYILQGADHIYIYDNQSQPSVTEILLPGARPFCTIIPWPGEGVKFAVMQHWGHFFGRDCEWVAMIDCDEFIQPLHHLKTIREFLLTQPKVVSAIAINWVFFGDNGKVQPIIPYQELAIETFTRRQAGINRHIKTIHRPQAVHPHTYRHPHCVHLTGGKYVDTNGNKYAGGPWNEGVKDPLLRVNHYWWRSQEEWQRKLNTIRDDNGKSRGGDLQRWIRWMETDNCNAIEDRSCGLGWGLAIREKLKSWRVST